MYLPLGSLVSHEALTCNTAVGYAATKSPATAPLYTPSLASGSAALYEYSPDFLFLYSYHSPNLLI